MQRGEKLADKDKRRAKWVLRKRNVTTSSYAADAGERSRVIYVVRMRHIPEGQHDDWATFVKRERRNAKLTQERFAERVGVARETVWRWESGRQKPESVETVRKVAEVLRVGIEVALIAAELHPGEAPAPDPRLRGLDPNDPVILHILSLDGTSEEEKVKMIDRRREILQRRHQQDIEDIEFYRRAKGA